MASLFNELTQFFAKEYLLFDTKIQMVVRNIVEYPVYDISNIVPMYYDIDNRGISKRPPDTLMWVEWRVDEKPGRFTYLILLVAVEKQAVFDGDFGDGVWEAVKDADELYTTVMFKRYDGGLTGKECDVTSEDGTIVSEAPAVGTISQENHQAIFKFTDDGKIVECIMLGLPDEEILKMGLVSDYRLPWSTIECKNEETHKRLMYMPFSAFSLLHCKNIKVVEVKPDEALQSARKRRGKLPLYSYHVLKLNVPIEEEHRVYGVSDDEDKIHMRYHMVRGHFKNLQHARFKQKGLYWWPVHWRGNPELGIVEKDYKIETDPRIK